MIWEIVTILVSSEWETILEAMSCPSATKTCSHFLATMHETRDHGFEPVKPKR